MKKITLLIALFTMSFGFAQTFTDSGGPYDIQNGNGNTDATCGTIDEISLPMDLSAESIGVLGTTNVLESVTFNATHTWNSDITVSLVSPGGGVTVDLIAGAGGDGDDFVDCILNDSAGSPLPTGNTTVTGTFLPDNPLSGFNGEAADGPWTLVVCDAANGDTGEVVDWSLTFGASPACFPPDGTVTVVDDCVNSQYFLDVNVTDTGSGTAVGIVVDGSFETAAGLGVTQVGPYVVGFAPANVVLWHETDLTCDVNLGDYLNGCPPGVPANDNFANAEAVSCDTTYYSNTTNATLDEDDAPDGFGADLDGPNVWYAYTDTGSTEEITLDLCASGYDTAYLVYTGTSGNLSIIAGNDDNASICGAGYRSYGTFQTLGDGTTVYYITVNGWDPGSVGAVSMTVTCAPILVPPPSNDECAGAEAITFNVLTGGTTVGATISAGEQPTCDPFGAVADVWYAFTAVTAGTYDVTTVATGTSDKASVAVYTDCTAAQVNSLNCGNNLVGGNTITVDLTAATTYYIKVWNDGNAPKRASSNRRAEGTFDIIVVDTPLSTEDFDANQLFTYFPNPVNNTLTLKAQSEIQNIAVYNILGQVVLNDSPNTLENNVDMTAFQSGAYFVKVTVNNVTETIRVIKN